MDITSSFNMAKKLQVRRGSNHETLECGLVVNIEFI